MATEDRTENIYKCQNFGPLEDIVVDLEGNLQNVSSRPRNGVPLNKDIGGNGNMSNKRQKTYSIGEAARICGVTEKQIRHWEELRHIPLAQRVICGKRAYRQFTDEDFRLICSIKRHLDEGFTLQMAVKKAAGKNAELGEVQDNGR